MSGAEAVLVTVINIASALIFGMLTAFCLILVVRSARFRFPALFLGFSFLLIFLVNVSNMLEYLAITAVMDKYEEYFEILFLPFILLFCYSWTTTYMIEKNLRFSKELQHRVKNNLQMIESLLAIQKAGMKDPAVAAELDKSRKRILSIGVAEQFLHENDGSRVDMKAYLETLIGREAELSFDAGRERSLEVLCDDVFLNAETAISCGLIVNELLMASSANSTVSLREIGDGAYRLSFSPFDAALPEGDIFSGQLVELLCSRLASCETVPAAREFAAEFTTATKEELRWKVRE